MTFTVAESKTKYFTVFTDGPMTKHFNNIPSLQLYVAFPEKPRRPNIINAIDHNRPYSEQRHDRYESEAERDRLTVFPMASAVKS